MTLSDKRKEFIEDMRYALDKFNWGNSALDAKAIGILNTWAKKLEEQDKEFINKIKERKFECTCCTDGPFDVVAIEDLDKLAGADLI